MSDFLKMDIFFVVTTIVVLVGGALSVVALYYLIRILKSIDHLAQNVSEESDNVRGDLLLLRTKVRNEGTKMAHFTDFFASLAKRRRARKKSVSEE